MSSQIKIVTNERLVVRGQHLAAHCKDQNCHWQCCCLMMNEIHLNIFDNDGIESDLPMTIKCTFKCMLPSHDNAKCITKKWWERWGNGKNKLIILHSDCKITAHSCKAQKVKHWKWNKQLHCKRRRMQTMILECKQNSKNENRRWAAWTLQSLEEWLLLPPMWGEWSACQILHWLQWIIESDQLSKRGHWTCLFAWVQALHLSV